VATGAYREAEATLRNSISLDSKNPEPHLELVKVLTAVGAKEEARREQKEAARLQRQDARVRH
jgi:Tfp pilus assembly protein PilF